jgi:glycosyltransferase involved in cell wall biosynthesis
VALTIVGDGPKRADYERLVREGGLEGLVTFLGAVGQDVIREHFAEADIFCLSSVAEGVPVVLMEAMAMGKPVVASRIMGISELVEDGVNGRLLPAGRADLLADALQELATDSGLRQRLGEAGRATVVAEFDVAHEARKLHALFERLPAQH